MAMRAQGDRSLMSDEEPFALMRERIQAILGTFLFGSDNSVALTLMVAHNISPKDLENKLGEIPYYLREAESE